MLSVSAVMRLAPALDGARPMLHAAEPFVERAGPRPLSADGEAGIEARGGAWKIIAIASCRRSRAARSPTGPDSLLEG